MASDAAGGDFGARLLGRGLSPIPTVGFLGPVRRAADNAIYRQSPHLAELPDWWRGRVEEDVRILYVHPRLGIG
jgi:hypothetical protein